MKFESFQTDFRFQKKAQVSSFIQIRLVAAELFRAERQTDMTKLIAALANTPKKRRRVCSQCLILRLGLVHKDVSTAVLVWPNYGLVNPLKVWTFVETCGGKTKFSCS
jgi:hypothetical protein